MTFSLAMEANQTILVQLERVLIFELAIMNCILKGWGQCFSMQVVKNKCFLLIPGKKKKKIGADLSCRFREKRTL